MNQHAKILFIALVTLAVSALTLVACSGGGGGGPVSPSSSQASSAGQPAVADRTASDAQSNTSAANTNEQNAPATDSSAAPAASQNEATTSASNETESASSAQGTNQAHSGTALQNFNPLSQYPELPNGCEVTSLASVLNFYGFGIDKASLSDAYLPKAPVGEADFYAEFVGDPRNDDAFGCYAPVIVSTANAYLSQSGSGMTASDLTGTPFRSLLSYIDRGVPVIVWATQHMQESYYSVTWNVNGQDMTWRTPEHCMVLVGYDNANNTVQVADPMTGGIESYDMDLFETRYNELYQQAVVIE